ncbi:MAG: hypothetical protein M3046_02345 [Actinomycetota bacterium]|nr:hypothetical protein [Actinomycetota bacterium]
MGTRWYVGTSAFLRYWPPGMIVFAAIVLFGTGRGAVLYGVLFTFCGLVSARYLPWRFAVLDDGIALWFAFGRRLFLPKDAVTVRVGAGSSVAYPEAFRRFGYPLTDGLVERRRKLLRAVLVEHGFRVA